MKLEPRKLFVRKEDFETLAEVKEAFPWYAVIVSCPYDWAVFESFVDALDYLNSRQ